MPQAEADPNAPLSQWNSRNESSGFARRTLKNLEYIEEARRAGQDVHVVTQRVLSLLGLIVFPWEQGFGASIKSLNLNRLVEEGWPRWDILAGRATTLGDLVRHLRNAVAHRRLWFSSEDRDPQGVTIEFADAKTQNGPCNWRAKISADHLQTFCIRFIKRVNDVVD